MPLFDQSKFEPVLELAKNNKITKGNIKKLREWIYNNRNSEPVEFINALATACTVMERDEAWKKAAHRPTFAARVLQMNKTDEEKAKGMVGCAGFQTIILS